MNTEEIEKFLDTKASGGTAYIKIDFKKRDAVYGLFVRDKDFNDLKSKNLWRIVTRINFDEYSKTNNINLAKIFNGTDFAKLSLYKEKEVAQ